MNTSNRQRQVVVLQHEQLEPPGLLQPILSSQGIDLRVIRPDRDEAVPAEVAGSAGLILMGGPMGMHEAEKYPWLLDELGLIERYLEAEVPVLGICLGSQLLATVLGAEVVRGVRPEFGWQLVELSHQASHDPLWAGIPSPFTAFHWHHDVFEPPEDAVNLARSVFSPCQAFAYREIAYGMLFHLEVTSDQVHNMLEKLAAESDSLNPAGIERGTEECFADLQQIAEIVFGRWAESLPA